MYKIGSQEATAVPYDTPPTGCCSSAECSVRARVGADLIHRKKEGCAAECNSIFHGSFASFHRTVIFERGRHQF